MTDARRGTSIAIRCDAGARAGLGHLSRTLALAEACRELGAVPRFFGTFEDAGQGLLEQAGMPFSSVTNESAAQIDTLANAAAGGLLVVDGYDFDAAYVRKASSAARLVLVDDFAALASYPAACTVLNFTLGASALPYPAEPRKLLGPAYFLARAAVRKLHGRGRSDRSAKLRILVAIGGLDSRRAAPRVLEAIFKVLPDGAFVTIAAGRMSPSLDLCAAALSPEQGAVRTGLASLAPLLAESDIVISGGGLTKYEATFVGLPTGVLSQTDGEAADTARFESAQLVVGLGVTDPLPTVDALANRLRPLLLDANLQATLQTNCTAYFPSDTTLNAARAILEAP